MATPEEILRAMCRDLERRHDLRRGFFADLLKQPDWAFVIQCHALVEAAVADALASHAANPNLRKVFDVLPTSEPRIGKMAFARAYDLVTDDQVKFVRTLSKLRNALAHRIGNVNFSLADHIAAMGPQAESWSRDMGRAGTPPMAAHLASMAGRQPKSALWFATVLFVYHVLPAP